MDSEYKGMTNEKNLETSELIGIAQVYATLALAEFTAAETIGRFYGERSAGYRDHYDRGNVLRNKAYLVVVQAEERGEPPVDRGVGPNPGI